MNKLLYFLGCMLFFSCSNYGQLTYVTKIPKKLDENSGMVFLKDSTVWMINDHGNSDKIYQLNFKGQLLKEFSVKNAKNKDWEDLTNDDNGHVYIADTGNNNNKRKDLTIYKIPNPEVEKGDKIDAQKIEFSYPDQKKFPPKRKNLRYDAEAIFYHQDHLYIITKNRSRPFNGETTMYRVPAKKGKYKATFLGSFISCKNYASCRITSADISPDGKTMVLLSYGKLWVFSSFNSANPFEVTPDYIDLGATTQLESVCFMNNQTLLLSDEQRAGTGRNLYMYTLQ